MIKDDNNLFVNNSATAIIIEDHYRYHWKPVTLILTLNTFSSFYNDLKMISLKYMPGALTVKTFYWWINSDKKINCYFSATIDSSIKFFDCQCCFINNSDIAIFKCVIFNFSLPNFYKTFIKFLSHFKFHSNLLLNISCIKKFSILLPRHLL